MNVVTVVVPGVRAHRSSRLLPVASLVCLGALPVIRYLQNGGPLLSAVGVLVGAVDLGVLPGLLVATRLGVCATRSIVERIAVGAGVSLAILQALTFLAISHQLSPIATISATWAACGALALLLLIWRPQKNRTAAPAGALQWAIVGLATVLGVSLYIQSPVAAWIGSDDALSVSVVQRLAFQPRPQLTNIFVVPHASYIYPFPVLEYFYALVSRATNLDALFVYQKMRLLWSPIALFTVYAVAQVVFQSDRVAFASAFTAGVLALGGGFGPIATAWGQMAPFSHPSDVAMTVILPLLLLFALRCVTADTLPIRAVFALAAIALVAALTIAHIREVVQFMVYAGTACFVYFHVAGVRNRGLAVRFGGLTLAAVLLVVGYLNWHQRAVGYVDPVGALRRRVLVDAMAALSMKGLLTPMFLDRQVTAGHEYFFYMWFPVILLLAPIVLLTYRSRPLVPFIAASLFAYAVIVFVPIVAMLYVYVTYDEILVLPVRNSVFFIYLLAGPLLLLASDAWRSIASGRRRPAVALVGFAALWLAYRFFRGVFERSPSLSVLNVFFLMLLGGYAVALLNWERLSRWLSRFGVDPPDGFRWPGLASFFALLGCVAMVGSAWQNSPLNVGVTASTWTSRQYVARLRDTTTTALPALPDPENGTAVSLADTEALMAAPTPQLAEFGRRRLPVDAVLVHNIYDVYAASVFMPQQIVMFPIDSQSMMDRDSRWFPTAWAALLRAGRSRHAQPFFNQSESLLERAAYMEEVGATHVLVDPMYYPRLRPLFPEWAPAFVPAYDDGRRWAVLTFDRSRVVRAPRAE